MRHRNRGRKLGRTSAHRKALGRNLLKSLFQYGKIITTLSKAKEYAPLAQKVVTIAKRAAKKIEELPKQALAKAGTDSPELQAEIQRQCRSIQVAAIRRIAFKIQDRTLARKVYYVIAPLYKERAGGYTSIVHLNKLRKGDNAKQAVLQLLGSIPKEFGIPKDEKKEAEKAKKLQERIATKRKQRERKAKEIKKAIEEKEAKKIQAEKEAKKEKK